MKVLVLGDIHGRTIWRNIIETESPDKIIFLGDYVPGRGFISTSTTIKQLASIMKLKQERPEDVILLRGNHDLEALGYSWAECYPAAPREVRDYMVKYEQSFLDATQWLYELEDGGVRMLFSHAGVSSSWLKNILRMDMLNVDEINSLAPCPEFGFCGGIYDETGTSPQQSCTWIRPLAMDTHALGGYIQIVGHTIVRGAIGKPVEYKTGVGVTLWLCDALEYGGYLIIEDGNFQPKQLKI